MSSIVARSAFRAAPRLRTVTVPRRASSVTASPEEKQKSKDAIKEGARRNPELYVLFAIMSGVFGLAGWHFSRSPTSSSDQRPVSKIPGSEPWNQGGSSPYQYAPYGDNSKGRKDAPSALNEVIIPNVTLPKELHDQYNKFGKDGF